MSDRDTRAESWLLSQDETTRLLKERIEQSLGTPSLEGYEALLMAIWRRLQVTLGGIAVVAKMQRAVGLTREKYPAVHYLQISPDGVSLDAQWQQAAEEKCVREALTQLMVQLFDILATLTGDILAHQLMWDMKRNERR